MRLGHLCNAAEVNTDARQPLKLALETVLMLTPLQDKPNCFSAALSVFFNCLHVMPLLFSHLPFPKPISVFYRCVPGFVGDPYLVALERYRLGVMLLDVFPLSKVV